MPMFKSVSELQSFLNQKLMVATLEAQEKIYRIIDDALREYYGEYEPEEYLRTYQLLKSLVKSNIEKTANGYKVYVYYDLSSMDYSMKYTKNYRGKQSNNWSAEGTMNYAAVGKHGSKYEGTSIWNDPVQLISENLVNIVKEALINSGVPVK